MDGLIVKQPFAGYIIEGRKKWEMRLRPPPADKLNREIYLLSGGYALGKVKIVSYVGPLSRAAVLRTKRLHGGASPRYRYGWVVKVVRRFRKPVRYRHPWGAQVWVRGVKLLR
ncbi:MAG: ASCH domain-containing protein [Candidatus Caldarchaeum sp.]|nr:ASCH domain-containing protein [Candidatus Caldarchaeum sp.]